MKKTFTIFIIACLLGIANLQAQSQVATLGHNGNTIVFYGINAFIEAYNASVNGDVINLSSGAFIDPPTIQKGITIIGAGHYPDSVNYATIVDNIRLGLGANHVLIEGIRIIHSIYNTDSVSFVTIRRCYAGCMTFNYSTNNVIVEGSVIIGNSGPCLSFSLKDNDLIIRNNIITISSSNSNITDIANGSIIENNIIQGGYYSLFWNVNNSVIQNNILYYSYGPYGIGGSVMNNIVKNNFMNSRSLDSIHNLHIHNYYGAIVNIFPNGLGNSFDFQTNYHIQNPTQYIGTDGTQIGIYGGGYPYKENAIPSNPHFVHKFIAPQGDADGNLQINIKVKAQNY